MPIKQCRMNASEEEGAALHHTNPFIPCWPLNITTTTVDKHNNVFDSAASEALCLLIVSNNSAGKGSTET